MGKRLLILGCSRSKVDSSTPLPALMLYDGPAYKVVRKYLRRVRWPKDLSIAVLSAEHGLFGSLTSITTYDKRMSPDTATEKATQCATVLREWAKHHDSVHIAAGKDYLPALMPALKSLDIQHHIFKGGIGAKLKQVKDFLNGMESMSRASVSVSNSAYKYFMPDWGEVLDAGFDFQRDTFSALPSERHDVHCAVLMRPQRMLDGILLSLAQMTGSTGILRRTTHKGSDLTSLAPPNLRSHFGLTDDQYIFGDCGAFSYVNEPAPAISVEQAVSLYDLYGFDFGASVDHIPVHSVVKNDARLSLPHGVRQERIRMTVDNAREFIRAAEYNKAGFQPVGTIQALTPREFAASVRTYYDFGYRRLAIGGLVRRSDKEIAAIVKSVMAEIVQLPERTSVHLFGIYRPKLQPLFRTLKVNSFDSASYFRKSWLNAANNYLSADGHWYAAIRVPMTRHVHMRRRLAASGSDLTELVRQERAALDILNLYDKGSASLEDTLNTVLAYDSNLVRGGKASREQYMRTLKDKPWTHCDCTFCHDLGIHMLIFRGSNRNKRRGAHNTLMLYRQVRSKHP